MQQPSAGVTPQPITSEDAKAKQLLLDEGNLAFDEDSFERALDCYHRASLIDGTDSDVWNLLGLTYTNLEFTQEAWRSFKLALKADPDNLDALWYSGEFLYGMEDMVLANLVLSRYLELEVDEKKREEALEMLKEARLTLDPSSEEAPPEPSPTAEDYDLADESDDGDELEGFGIEGDDAGSTQNNAEQDADHEDEFSGNFDDIESVDDEAFVASLVLQLEVADSKCKGCMTPIPQDAPYCYSCKAPHFYESR